MTTPFISNAGIALGVPSQRLTPYQRSLRLFEPFTWTMWWVTLAMVVAVAAVTWIAEHGDQKIPDGHLPDEPEAERPVGAHGYLNVAALRQQWPAMLHESFLTLTAHGARAPLTPGGLVFNAAWCVFAMLWAVTYTANLATMLAAPALLTDVGSLAEMDNRQLSACVKANTAYSAFLSQTYPRIKLVYPESGNALRDVARDLADGKCAGVVDAAPFLEALSLNAINLAVPGESEDFCMLQQAGVNLVMAGAPMPWGPTDMAVGVKMGEHAVQSVLSYWIQRLRSCSRDDTSDVCWMSVNMYDLYTETTTRSAGECATTDEDGLDVSSQLDWTHFMLPLGMVFVAGVYFILVEAIGITFLRRLLWFSPLSDYDELLHFASVLATDQPDRVSVKAFSERWRLSPNLREACAGMLLRHYARSDVVALRQLERALQMLEQEWSYINVQHKHAAGQRRMQGTEAKPGARVVEQQRGGLGLRALLTRSESSRDCLHRNKDDVDFRAHLRKLSVWRLSTWWCVAKKKRITHFVHDWSADDIAEAAALGNEARYRLRYRIETADAAERGHRVGIQNIHVLLDRIQKLFVRAMNEVDSAAHAEARDKLLLLRQESSGGILHFRGAVEAAMGGAGAWRPGGGGTGKVQPIVTGGGGASASGSL